MLYSILQGCQLLGSQIFHPICSRLGYREGLSLSFVFMSSALLMCYFSTSIWGFVIPAVLFGSATALRTLINSFSMIELMPDNYALAAGLGNCGGAFSILFWGWISLLVMNPDNERPDLETREYTRTVYYIGEEVTSQVPKFFLVTMFISIIAGF
jgi:MFS family permease